MEQNKDYNASSSFFKLTTQEFKDQSISCNDNLRKTQVLLFQGINEVCDDYDAFEHLLYLLTNHVNRKKKSNSAYEQLCE